VTPTIESLRARRLPLRWYRRDPATIARALIGCALVHRDRAAMIVETEAYLGPEDLASHARFGSTTRNAVMFGPGGVSYVYLCYGVHEMFNVVTGAEGAAGAVLVRAAAPLIALPDDDRALRGPGKLTKALGLSRTQDRVPLDGDELFIARWRRIAAPAIARSPRIGVDYAGAWAKRPLRFTLAGHPAVSRGSR
jgi:DNA-3-methyladenine glycosylase